ncbi:MAG: DUF5680 domain-containing protein [Bacteroidota bacterium]
MSDFSLKRLRDFIVRAKSATYAGDGPRSPSCRPGSKDLRFEEEPFAYLDSYFGEADFIGEEVVYYEGQPVWAMNYHGRLLEPALLSSADVGRILKESLSALYKEGRFLGGFEYATPKGTYVDTNVGGVEMFSGREWIVRDGRKAYELLYHGGFIK